MTSDRESKPVGGDRPPSEADRPPVSRVGDELNERSEHRRPDESDDEVEREAFDAAKEKGWDKPVEDT